MGYCYIDVTADVLGDFLAWMPRSFTVYGSLKSESEGVVRLMLRNEELVGARGRFTCEISEEGIARTIRMVPAAEQGL